MSPKSYGIRERIKIQVWKRYRITSFTIGHSNLVLSTHPLPHYTGETQQSPAILDLCIRKPRSGKSHDHRDVIVFVKLCFQGVLRPLYNVNLAFSNSSGLKSVFEKLRFLDGLGWMEGIPIRRNKVDLQIYFGAMWTLPKIKMLCSCV